MLSELGYVFDKNDPETWKCSELAAITAQLGWKGP